MYTDIEAGEFLENNEEIGESRFDHLAETLNKNLIAVPHIVKNISCDGVGGFNLVFDNGLHFDAFTSVSHNHPAMELWRLFKPASEDDHFIVETLGLHQHDID